MHAHAIRVRLPCLPRRKLKLSDIYGARSTTSWSQRPGIVRFRCVPEPNAGFQIGGEQRAISDLRLPSSVEFSDITVVVFEVDL